MLRCAAPRCGCLTPAAWQLLSVQRSLTAYYERFKAFLNPVNAKNLQLLLRIAAALHGCLAQNTQPQLAHSSSKQQPFTQHTAGPGGGGGAAAAGRVVGVNDLLFDLGLDNINMFDLARWVRDNKMAFKVSAINSNRQLLLLLLCCTEGAGRYTSNSMLGKCNTGWTPAMPACMACALMMCMMHAILCSGTHSLASNNHTIKFFCSIEDL
jgi:hypothetical protein